MFVQSSQRGKQYGMSIYSWDLMYTIQEFVKSDANLVKTLQVIDKLSDFYVENKRGQEQTWLLWFAVQDNIIGYNTTNYENALLFFFFFLIQCTYTTLELCVKLRSLNTEWVENKS